MNWRAGGQTPWDFKYREWEANADERECVNYLSNCHSSLPINTSELSFRTASGPLPHSLFNWQLYYLAPLAVCRIIGHKLKLLLLTLFSLKLPLTSRGVLLGSNPEVFTHRVKSWPYWSQEEFCHWFQWGRIPPQVFWTQINCFNFLALHYWGWWLEIFWWTVFLLQFSVCLSPCVHEINHLVNCPYLNSAQRFT